LTVPAIRLPRQTTGSVSFSIRRLRLISLTPVLVSTGRIPSSLPMARSWMPKALGMEGPVISASSTAAFLPAF
jgi:hypothetical protein